MDYTILIFVFIILFGYIYLYLGGRYYLRQGFVGTGPMGRNNVPPEPHGF